MRKKVESKIENRVPIVSILGHVDHGKTTILDFIRHAHVQSGEVGGITQKISAFTIDVKGKKITFVDTPGHEAFDLMRTRGGSIADIVLLIVAANDGVKPQTEESIEIIKKSKAKPIVVINKIDLPNLDIKKVKREVNDKGILLEGLGGNTPVVLVSGKTGEGIDLLLETISLVAEVEGLEDRGTLPEGVFAKGFVLESIKEKSRGNVSTVVVTNGKLTVGDWIGYTDREKVMVEKIKGIITEEGSNLESLDTGYGGKILGLSVLVALGSEVFAFKAKDEKLVKKVFVQVKEEERAIEEEKPLDLSMLFGGVKTEDKKVLNVIVKASSQGALEALRKALGKIEVEGFTVNITADGVGDISLADAQMAKLTKSIVLGFETKMDNGVEELSRKSKILVRSYDLIYKLTDEVVAAIELLANPGESEEEIGSGEVKQIFTLSNGSQVIGCRVMKGVIKKGCKIYIVRGDDIIGEGKIESLRHLKDTITQAEVGVECGVILGTPIEAVLGDTLYCYKIIK
ncbi:translation initiation factor IF-2 [Candidatus Dojkabacteria bacterium]|jgi:translation initiation factor IF-2|nr:translation initiation factor IF-2 [Candidatus Dojkabacteria bacterium]